MGIGTRVTPTSEDVPKSPTPTKALPKKSDPSGHVKFSLLNAKSETKNTEASTKESGQTQEEAQTETEPESNVAPPPKIDVNKLIYCPRPKKEGTYKERVKEKLPDYAFLIVNFLTVIVPIYYLMLGLTVLSFTSSIQSLIPLSLDAEEVETTKEEDKPTILHPDKHSTPSTIGIIFIVSSLVQIFNTFFGIYGCVEGYKNILILHTALDVIFLFGELILGSLITANGKCEPEELNLTQANIMDYIRLYNTEKTSLNSLSNPDIPKNLVDVNYQLDSLQFGLSCCGALSWADYLNPDIMYASGNPDVPPDPKIDLDGTEVVIPSSCCRPWWMRNVHCSRGVHLWTHPAVDEKTAKKFRYRINQVGCIVRIKQGCERIHYMAGKGLLIASLIDCLLVFGQLICVIVIVKSILKKIAKRKEMIAKDATFPEENQDTFETIDLVEDGNLMVPKVEMAMPTEDDIELIKARSDFNKFEARVKRTHIGKWLEQARKSVHMTLNQTSTLVRPSVVDKDILSRVREQASNAAKAQGIDLVENPKENEDHHDAYLDPEELLRLEIEKHDIKQKEMSMRHHSQHHQSINPSAKRHSIFVAHPGRRHSIAHHHIKKHGAHAKTHK